ncbi:MAG: hypothetical protein R3B47_15855 [Bacteroidia bacterium]
MIHALEKINQNPAYCTSMNLKALLFTIAIFSGTGSSCLAGGYLSPWLGGWYLGLSGAGSAGIQDPGTILINPGSACLLARRCANQWWP